MKLVCISDTHGQHWQLDMPEGDVLIHSGDFTMSGSQKQFSKFAKWLSRQEYQHKIVIPGNHDWLARNSPRKAKDIIEDAGAYYLIDQEIYIEGFKFYGSPWSVQFGRWAFMKEDKDLEEVYKYIPLNTDILITHGPPKNIGDLTLGNVHAGSSSLRKRVLELEPKYHIFGHIHEGYGVYETSETTYINASSCTANYHPENKPIEIKLER